MMRRLPGIGAAFHALKWTLLFMVASLLASIVTTPISAILFVLAGPIGGLVGFLLWAGVMSLLLWLASRRGRRARREGSQRPHTQDALLYASPPPDLAAAYDLLDIGVKPWRDANQVFRDEAAPADLPLFYPIVSFWMHQSYTGRLTFTFYDQHGNPIPRLTRSKQVLLLAGLRNITINNPVDMTGHPPPNGIWEMHVSLDDRVLAVHQIAWYPVGADDDTPASDFIYPHTEAAIRLANSTINDTPATLTDIGLIAINPDHENVGIIRTEPVALTVDAVRPFIRLQLPEKAIGTIRFELVDASGEPLLSYQEHHEYDVGDNLIVSGDALRRAVTDVGAGWRLNAYVGDVLIAAHQFDWQDDTNPTPIREPLENDGEITPELRQRLEDQAEQVSLDDLLNNNQQRQSR